jgi:hypothetical protein
VYPRPFRQWLRAFFERGCLAAWMLLMMVNTVILGLSAELLLFGTIFSFGHIVLIDERSAPMLLLGVFAALNFPVVVKLREYGVENLNFEIHEHALNSFMDPPETWSNAILALLDETALRSSKLELLVRLIDEAPGPVERQDRRTEAKAWLKENRDQLTDEDNAFARDYLGYLR